MKRFVAVGPTRERVSNRLAVSFAALLLMASAAAFGSSTAVAPEEAERGSSTPLPACETGVVVDDGSLETGYGWVPSVVDGRYVQEFRSEAFAEPGLASVCVCWTRNFEQDEIDFAVELYRLTEDGPLASPEISVPARATAVPVFPEGRFYEVELPSPPIPAGRFAVGVRWNAQADRFFFVCADQSPTTDFVDGWFIDDRADSWAPFFDSSDPIFADHAALLLRPVAGDPILPIEIPALTSLARLALAAGLALVAVFFLRRFG